MADVVLSNIVAGLLITIVVAYTGFSFKKVLENLKNELLIKITELAGQIHVVTKTLEYNEEHIKNLYDRTREHDKQIAELCTSNSSTK